MGFSFRLKKKKDATTPSSGSAAAKKSSKKQSSSRRTNTFSTPLGSIRENGGGTDKTMPTTPVITNVRVMENPDGGTELVFGEIPKMVESNEAEKDEPTLVEEKFKQEEQVPEIEEEDVKKQLFVEEDELLMYLEDEDAKPQPVVTTSVPEPVVVDKPFDEPFFDEPFDEKEMKKEDPYMLELMQTESYDEKERALKRQQMQRSKAIPQTKGSPAVKGLQDAAQNMMEAFACNSDTTMFYDALCADPKVRTRKRPFFNEAFAIAFINEVTDDGIPMLYHVPPTNPIDNDWTGQSMEMYIRPGDCTGVMTRHPKLVWMTASGGYSRLSGTAEVLSFAVGLMDIHSIMDSMDDDDSEGEDLFFFSITTNSGDVHLFECPTEDERDRIVSGIKNIIARMSFSLVAGDEVVMSELYGGDEEEEGELPSLRTPQQEMATVSHEFLDSIAPGVVPKRTTSTLIEV